MENDVLRLEKDGRPFWLAGLGDQEPFRYRDEWRGVDDLPGTLAKVTDDAPVLLMHNEPRIFPRVPPRVALTVSGHTMAGRSACSAAHRRSAALPATTCPTATAPSATGISSSPAASA